VAGLISTMGRKSAFNIAAIFVLGCGSLILAIAWFVVEDEDRVQKAVLSSLQKQLDGHEGKRDTELVSISSKNPMNQNEMTPL
jgi:hypothetical protein